MYSRTKNYLKDIVYFPVRIRKLQKLVKTIEDRLKKINRDIELNRDLLNIISNPSRSLIFANSISLNLLASEHLNCFLKHKISVDFTISLGVNCRPAEQLRMNGLRVCSNPLDWMFHYSLDSVLSLFLSNFENFFKEKSEINYDNKNWRKIEDQNSGMVSIHHFPKNQSIDRAYTEFNETMKRRYLRMVQMISKSDHVLLLSTRNEFIDTISEFLEKFRTLYCNRYTLLNIRHRDNKDGLIEYNFRKISDQLEVIDYAIHDVHINGSERELNPAFWRGNCLLWAKILSQITLSGKNTPPTD